MCDGCWQRLEAGGGGGGIQPPSAPVYQPRNESSFGGETHSTVDEDLERAIAASLKDTTGRTPKPATVKSPPPISQDEDEDLREAIEASLRETSSASIDGNSRAPEYKYKAPKKWSEGSVDSSSVKMGVDGYDERMMTREEDASGLTEVEMENMKLFSELVERMEREGGQGLNEQVKVREGTKKNANASNAHFFLK